MTVEIENTYLRPTAAIEPLALPVDDAAAACGIARTRIYEAISNKELTARKSGRATIVEVVELRRWIRSLPTRGRSPDPAALAD